MRLSLLRTLRMLLITLRLCGPLKPPRVGHLQFVQTRGTSFSLKGSFYYEVNFHWWDFTIWIEVDTSVIMDRALERDKGYFGDEEAVRHVYENRCLPAQDYHIRRDLPKHTSLPRSRGSCGLYTYH